MGNRRRRITPASSVLPSALSGRKWKIFLPRRAIWQNWEEVAGKALSSNAWPWYFKDNTCLVIAVSDNMWQQQLTYQKQMILDKLNKFLPEESRLEDIRFNLGDIETVRKNVCICHGRQKDKQKEAPVSSGISIQEISAESRQLLENIDDQELRESLLSLMKKAGGSDRAES